MKSEAVKFSQPNVQTTGIHEPPRPVQEHIGKKDVSSKYQLRETSSNRPWKPSPSPEVKEPEKEPEEPPRETGRMFTPRESIVSKLPGGHLIHKIKDKLLSKAFSQRVEATKQIIMEEKPSPALTCKVKRRRKTHVGWTTPKVDYIAVPLPELKVKLTKRQRPTIDDLPNIREKATIALDEFYKNMQKETVRHSYEHWEKLYADTIRPKKLMDNFLSVYRAYSPHKQEEAFVVCPWIPGPYRHFRRATAQINQSPSPFGSYSNFSSARYDNTVVRDGRKSECEVRSLSSFM